MKLVLIALSLVALCLAAMYGVPQYQRSREAARRQQYLEDAAKNEVPLVLDARTSALLAGADRVETFRLVDNSEDQDEGQAPSPVGTRKQLIDDYQVLRVGPMQDKVFAATLRRAVAQVPGPIGKDGMASLMPSCFEPGFAFRVWQGKSHVDICVCFHCTGIQLFTEDPRHNFSHQLTTTLGSSRAAFLALSKQAFSNDANIVALK